MKLDLRDLPAEIGEVVVALPGGELVIDPRTLVCRQARPAAGMATAEVIEAFRRSQADRGLARATVACYEPLLEGLAGWAPEWPPGAEQVADFLRGYRERGRSPVTLFEYWSRLNTLFRWAQGQGYLVDNPMRSVPRPAAPRSEVSVIKPQDLVRVINFLRNETAGQRPRARGLPYERAARDLAIIRFTYSTGCRVGEVAGLRVRDVDLVCRSAIIQAGKSRRREVYFGRQAQRAMGEWLEVRGEIRRLEIGDWVFLATKGNGWSGRPMTRSGLRLMWRARQRQAGIGPYTFHEIRHSHVTHSMDNGIGLHHVSRQAGHSSPEITARVYVHSQDEERRRAYEVGNPDDRLGA